jgi:hypothetical protein
MILKVLLTFFALSLATKSAADQADPGPLFGPEFTFYKDGLQMYDLVGHMEDHLVAGQPDGQKFKVSQRNFTSPNGWGFSVNPDGLGVVEVTMLPMTVAAYERFARDIQDAIFTSAHNRGAWPSLFRGGGHINMDLNYFQFKPTLLRNFIVDQINHSELSLGIMNYDTANAVPIATSPEMLKAVEQAINDFDENMAKANPDQYDLFINQLLEKLDTHIRGVPLNRGDVWQRAEQINKASSISFTRAQPIYMRAMRRIEIRAVRPQTSIYVWIKQIKLIRDRLHFLERAFAQNPIPLKVRVPILWNDNRNLLIPPVNPQDALREFYIFVRESGHRWADHREYIWPMWVTRQEGHNQSEVELFESSSWIKEQENRARPGTCLNLLSTQEI